MNSDHEHIVGFEEQDYEGGYSRLVTIQRAQNGSAWGEDYERFSFCPRCGGALSKFWMQLDALQDKRRQQYELKEKQAEQERHREMLYRNTPPT